MCHRSGMSAAMAEHSRNNRDIDIASALSLEQGKAASRRLPQRSACVWCPLLRGGEVLHLIRQQIWTCVLAALTEDLWLL